MKGKQDVDLERLNEMKAKNSILSFIWNVWKTAETFGGDFAR